VLHADLAGIDPGSVDISVDGSLLTITAQRKHRYDDDVRWLARSGATGTFHPPDGLGEDIDRRPESRDLHRRCAERDDPGRRVGEAPQDSRSSASGEPTAGQLTGARAH